MNETRTIPLTKGKVAVVDAGDYDALSRWSWCATCNDGHWYAFRNTRSRREGWQRQVYMHRQIMDDPADLTIDHVNGDGLDNRRCNLRTATLGQNMANQRKTRGRSKYKGVTTTWNGKWRAGAKKDRRMIHCGVFDDEVAAALAYDVAAIKLWGQYARPNFLEVAP